MKRALGTAVATIVTAGVIGTTAATAAISGVETTFASGAAGAMLAMDLTNICDQDSFSTVRTVVGRSAAAPGTMQYTGAYFNLFRWNGSGWILSRNKWSGWDPVPAGYTDTFQTAFSGLSPGYYHLEIDYWWYANGAYVGRAYDTFNGRVYAKYTGVTVVDSLDAINTVGYGVTPLQDNYCYVG